MAELSRQQYRCWQGSLARGLLRVLHNSCRSLLQPPASDSGQFVSIMYTCVMFSVGVWVSVGFRVGKTVSLVWPPSPSVAIPCNAYYAWQLLSWCLLLSCRFMLEYSTPLQFAKIILVSQILQALGVPYANLCVYMAGKQPFVVCMSVWGVCGRMREQMCAGRQGGYWLVLAQLGQVGVLGIMTTHVLCGSLAVAIASAHILSSS